MQNAIKIFLLILTTSLFFLVSSSFSGEGDVVYKSKCGKCHTSGGEAPVFSPVKFASSQWDRFFSRNKHARKKDISSELSAEELKAVQKYLMDHAADSDRPVAAGLR